LLLTLSALRQTRSDCRQVLPATKSGRVAANYDGQKDVFSNLATALLSLAAKRQKR